MLRYTRQTPKNSNQSANSEISRIVSAAVVNKHFCSKLLTNPSFTISQGYGGEPFYLSVEQKERIATIKENSLEGFAAQLARI